MGKRKPAPQPVQGNPEDFVRDAMNDAEELKDELQSWRDNLPENLQSGSKADELDEAITNLEAGNEPDMPDCLSELTCEYQPARKVKSRADRLNDAIARVEAAAACARSEADRLDELEYPDEDADNEPVDHVPQPGDPETEDERDSKRDELNSFADECDDLASEWQNVTFPGMY